MGCQRAHTSCRNISFNNPGSHVPPKQCVAHALVQFFSIRVFSYSYLNFYVVPVTVSSKWWLVHNVASKNMFRKLLRSSSHARSLMIPSTFWTIDYPCANWNSCNYRIVTWRFGCHKLSKRIRPPNYIDPEQWCSILQVYTQSRSLDGVSNVCSSCQLPYANNEQSRTSKMLLRTELVCDISFFRHVLTYELKAYT